MVTVGSILRGTFQFARNNIPAILAWSAIMLVCSILMMTLLMRPFYEAQLATLQPGTGATPSFGPFFWLCIPLMTALFLVLWAAVFRAVLVPADLRFFYVRLGMDELRLLGLMLIFVLAAIALEIIGVIAVILVGSLLSPLLGKVAGMAIGAVLGFVLFGAFIWVAIRISLAAPLTLLQRKITIMPAWRLSRGHFWRLFGAYLVIVLILFATYLVLMMAQMGPVMADMLHPTDPEAARRVAEWQIARSQFGVPLLIYAVFSALMGGVSLAFQAGMTAVATRELLAGQSPASSEGPWS